MRGGEGIQGRSVAGKRGLLRMVFELNSNGRTVLRELHRRAPIIVQQALYFDERMPLLPCVYILSAGGPVVEGDCYEHDIRLQEGALAHISTGAYTKVAQMEQGEAHLLQHLSLAEGSYLEYLPEPTIPCAGAAYKAECEISIAPSATLFHSEIYTSGRRYSGERYRYRQLDLSLRVLRPDGEPLFCERQLIEPHNLDIMGLGIMSSNDVFASVVVIAPRQTTLSLYHSIEPIMQHDIALGVHLLPFESGLMCRIIGRESELIKRKVRSLCSLLREIVHGEALPDEFAWR